DRRRGDAAVFSRVGWRAEPDLRGERRRRRVGVRHLRYASLRRRGCTRSRQPGLHHRGRVGRRVPEPAPIRPAAAAVDPSVAPTPAVTDCQALADPAQRSAYDGGMKPDTGDDPTLTPDQVTQPATDESRPVELQDMPGYQLGNIIGRGGMGEVVIALDIQF